MKCIMVALCLAVAVAFAMGAQTTNVQAKKKVTYKLKKGTLTIKGKGNMPKKIKVKKKKVKKVVIKKGVKSISNNAFKGFTKVTKITIAKSVKKIGVNAFQKTAIKKLTIPVGTTKLGKGFIDNCKKLDFVTIPGNFKIIDKNGAVCKNRGATKGTNLETVTFSSNLDYNAAGYFRTFNFETAATDSSFKAYDGVLYTKDGSGIVRVPSARDTVVLRNGCTDFNTYAVTYKSSKSGSFVCFDLVKVTLPQSVTRVNTDKYEDEYASNEGRSLDIVFDNTKLEMPEIAKIKNCFFISPETLMKKLPARVTKSDDMYVGDGEYLLAGCDKGKCTIPDGITTICEYAFVNLTCEDVTLPATVTRIDKGAFENTKLKKINLDNVKTLGVGVFSGDEFQSVEVPAAITALPDYTFNNCTSLAEVKFNGEVKSLGAYSLFGTRIDINDFLKANAKLETIGESAFQNIGWTNITIPANIKTVGDFAFYESSNTKFAQIMGNTAGFSQKAFGARMNVTFQFSGGIAQAWTYPDHDYYKSGKNKKLSVWWDKVSEANGYEIWIAKDAKLSKGVKKYTAKYNEKTKTVSIKAKKAKGLKYFGIRPYKTENGKKVYGKWSIKKL